MYVYDAEQSVAKNEISNMSSDMILAINVEGFLVYANAAAERIFQQSRSELLGRSFLSMVHPDFHNEISAYLHNQINEKLPNSYYEYPVVRGRGKTIWLGQDMQLLIHDGQVEGLVAIARDISYRKAAQREQLDKAIVTSIKKLSCTICHVVNQPIQVINGHAELLASGLPDGHPLKKHTAIILEQVGKVSTMTRGLMNIKDLNVKTYLPRIEMLDIDVVKYHNR
jgi:PAS domain S-box-containing protein